MRIDVPVRIARFCFAVVFLLHAVPAAAQDFTALPMLDTTDPTPGDGICGPAPDGSRCSLRAAFQEANALGRTHFINVLAGRHLIVGPAGDDDSAFGDLDVHGPAALILRGEGVSLTRCERGGCFGGPIETLIDAGGIDRAFHVHEGGILRLENLAIEGGGERHGHDDDIYTTPGGAIFNAGGQLTLDNVAITDSRGIEGGAILNRGTATIRFSLFYFNGAVTRGGAIASSGPLVVEQSAIDVNGAGDNGGGLALLGGSRARVTLRHLTLTENRSRGSGGGLFVEAASTIVTLAESRVANNRATHGGGGIYNDGELTIDRTTIESNTGAGIVNANGLTITRTNILRNRGGGISNSQGLRITESTIANNFTEFDGGGIRNVRTEGFVGAVLTNVTISGNRAARHGGGIFNPANIYPVTLEFVTITGNTAASGSGVFGHTGSFQARGTVIAGNAGNDCFQHDTFLPSPPDAAINLSGDRTCFPRSIGEPMLGPLADNGGRTLTHAPLDGSALIDAVRPTFCVDLSGAEVRVDQRGTRRPAGASCDVGAFEVTRPLPPWATLPPGVFFDIEISVGRLTPLSIDLLKHVAGDSEAEPMAMKMAAEAEAMSAAFDAFMQSQDAFAGADAIAQLSARFDAFTKILKAFETCCAQQAPKQTAALADAQADLAEALADAAAPLAEAIAEARLQRLIAKVKALPLADGIRNSLAKQLEARAFGAFVQHVEAQGGKKLDAATADALIAELKELAGGS